MKKKLFIVLSVFLVLLISFSMLIGCSDSLGDKIGEATISIECTTILDNMKKAEQGLIDNNLIPDDGIILEKVSVSVYEKDNVYTLLKRVCKQNNIHLHCDFEPVFKTYYIKGINHIYEMSVGESSGWMYFVNNEQPNQGASLVKVANGDEIRFAYTVIAGDLQ